MVGPGIAFRTEAETLFDKGRKLATNIRGSDLGELRRNIALYVEIPGRATYGTDLKMGPKQTVAKYNREFILAKQENLRQFVAGYLTGCERSGRTTEGITRLFNAYTEVLRSFLGHVKDELNRIGLDKQWPDSVPALKAKLDLIIKEAMDKISKENPGATGRNLELLAANALENDERLRSRYSSAKRRLEAVKNLEAQERNLIRVIDKLPEIERATKVGGETLAKSLSRLFKAPGRLEVLPTRLKIAGAAAVVAISGILGFIYGLATENNEPKTIRPVKIK